MALGFCDSGKGRAGTANGALAAAGGRAGSGARAPDDERVLANASLAPDVMLQLPRFQERTDGNRLALGLWELANVRPILCFYHRSQ